MEQHSTASMEGRGALSMAQPLSFEYVIRGEENPPPIYGDMFSRVAELHDLVPNPVIVNRWDI